MEIFQTVCTEKIENSKIKNQVQTGKFGDEKTNLCSNVHTSKKKENLKTLTLDPLQLRAVCGLKDISYTRHKLLYTYFASICIEVGRKF